MQFVDGNKHVARSRHFCAMCFLEGFDASEVDFTTGKRRN